MRARDSRLKLCLRQQVFVSENCDVYRAVAKNDLEGAEIRILNYVERSAHRQG